MTETDWLAGADPDAMLRHLCGNHKPPGLLDRLGWRSTPLAAALTPHASKRKLQMLACACCRRIQDLLPDERCLALLNLLQAIREGLISEQELKKAQQAALDAADETRSRSLALVSGVSLWGTLTAVRTPLTATQALLLAADGSVEEAVAAAVRAATESAGASPEAARWAATALGAAARVQLLYDIFGNPFQLPTLDSAWLDWSDGAIRKMATVIYADLAFDRLPILADALEDAICANEAILKHCRGTSTHVRGCWLLDLLLLHCR